MKKLQIKSPYFSYEILKSSSCFYITDYKIRSFSQLALGWHYGEGGPISKAVIAIARRLNRIASHNGVRKTDAFPGLDGRISLTLYKDDDFYEFILEAEGAITFAHDRGNQEVNYLEGLTIQKAEAIINSITSPLWTNIYASSTKNTMIQKRNSLTVQLFQEAGGFQLFKNHVSSIQAWESASTYKSTMQTLELPAIHQFSGNSPVSNFHTIVSSSKKPRPVEMSVTTISRAYEIRMRAA